MEITVRPLTEDEYPLWDNLLATSPQRSIYNQRWWIDIVTHGQARLLGCFSSNNLLGGLPIWPCSTLGVPRLRQPPLTPYWGPLLAPLEGKAVTRLSNEMHILRAMADALDPWPDVTMQFHPSLSNWLPFHWNGFTQVTRYTYRIHDLSDMKQVEKACDENVPKQVRKAQRNGVMLRDMIDPMDIMGLHSMSMANQGARESAEIVAFWPLLSRAAQDHGCLFTTQAHDAEGNVHSACAAVWDDRYAYGIYNGNDPRFRRSCGGMLTFWRILELAGNYGIGFDFEGSSIEPVEKFFRQFGGELCPFMLVTRGASRRLNTARYLQHGLSRGKAWLDAKRPRREAGDEAAA